ncbi:MFS transporter [Acaricomes phytoseiuli]|uniref:MFS transporter n=1 Tax=Acaricomes phytoseiuli TaxID=291968 RepID=UPI0012E9AB02|nr:MFS transporter [Acaricomes phytoseiuli]MCW1249909.1 MFS transporter [Acaricomes phytoseiuli]
MASMFRALRAFNYRLWVAGALVSNIGTWVQRVAQDWLVLTVLTDHSGTAVGITTGLQFLPILILGPWAGLLSDRYSKRRLIICTQTAMGFCALILGLLVVTDAVQLWHVYVLALMLGIGSAIDAPARQAFVSEVVHSGDVPNAVALNSASFNLARMAGPGLAGLLIAWVGTGPAFLINAASFFAVIISLLKMRPAELQPTERVPRGRGQIREGLRYLRGQPELRMVLVLGGVVATATLNFQMVNAMMATEVFRQGPGEYGLLGTIMAVGTLSGALLAARRGATRLSYLVLAALALGIFSVLAAFAPGYWLYALALIPIGIAAVTFLNLCNTTIQLGADPAFRGRVLALYMMVVQGGTPLGAPLIGWIGTAFGPRWSLIIGGAVAVLAAVLAGVVLLRRGGVPLRTRLQTQLVQPLSHPRQAWTASRQRRARQEDQP